MSKVLKPNALTLWEEKDYSGATKIGLSTVVAPRFRDASHFAETFLNLTYALYSAAHANLFNEFKLIFSKYMLIVEANKSEEPPNGYHNHACLMQHNLRATIFQHYENQCSIDDLVTATRLLAECSAKAVDPSRLEGFNAKLLRMVDLILQEKNSYFSVAFNLPFSLPLPDGTYEVEHFSGNAKIAINSFQAEDLSSKLGDRYFSRVEVTFKGFTSTDNYWIGPNIESDDREPRNSRIALSIVNRIILEAKLIDESLRTATVSQRDIGNVSTTQYDGEGTVLHSSTAFTFGGLSLVDVLARQQASETQIQRLLERLAIGTMSIHENLYAQALIQRDSENLIGSYYLLNSATEAMIDHFVLAVSRMLGKSCELDRFLLGESICETCQLFKASPTTTEPPRSANPPSPFQRLKFLQEISIIESPETRRLQKLLATIRSDNLRNDLSHGRKIGIPSITLDKAITAFRTLRSKFANLIEKANISNPES